MGASLILPDVMRCEKKQYGVKSWHASYVTDQTDMSRMRPKVVSKMIAESKSVSYLLECCSSLSPG